MKRIIFLLAAVISSPSGLASDQYKQKPRSVEGEKEIKLVNDLVEKMRFGLDFALRFQALENENKNPAESIAPLSPGFSNANGNLNLLFNLDKGISTYIEAYLSSEHHEEMWMREGYLFVDSLEMLNSPFINGLMKYLSFKAGQMEINYGDYHFRRTDNGQALRNPFIGNYIIDANTTEIGIETMLNYEKWEFLLGLTGGATTGDTNEGHGIGKYSKLAYNFLEGESNLRVSGTVYQVDHSENPRDRALPGSTRNGLYSGNRSGSPFKSLFGAETDAGQILPNASQDFLAYILNVYWSAGKTEVFLDYDVVSDKDIDGSESSATLEEAWSQYAVDVKYNFTSKLYGALRYNVADHLKASDKSSNEKVTRYQGVVGYFINPSVLTKLEYVYQDYAGFQNNLKGGKFHGVVLEGTVSF
jgi:hypothetical protein